MTIATDSMSREYSDAYFENPQPGTDIYEKDLIHRFEQAKKSRGNTYQPRTKHLKPDGWAKYTNRLFLETSPYLLQHAHNPVNWYPWGEEAFETAKRLNRPVFLSIGEGSNYAFLPGPPVDSASNRASMSNTCGSA